MAGLIVENCQGELVPVPHAARNCPMCPRQALAEVSVSEAAAGWGGSWLLVRCQM